MELCRDSDEEIYDQLLVSCIYKFKCRDLKHKLLVMQLLFSFKIIFLLKIIFYKTKILVILNIFYSNL